MKRLVFIACGVVWAAATVADAAAQPADTTIRQAAELARFEEARALAVDPAGRLYVADAGADVVVRLDPQGRLIDRLGGPGTAPGAFDGPADVDPTNGLVLVVADAGNGRIQRFTNAFRPLEALPVGRGAEGSAGPAYEAGAGSGGLGRPVAVATAAAGAVFAVEASQDVVLKWGESGRRAGRVIGGFGEGAGRLDEPVALAVGADGLLFVADRGRAAVLAYDLFGGFVRTIAEGEAEDVQAVTVHDGALWIVLPERLLVYEPEGRRVRTVAVHLGEPLVDAALSGPHLYLLTPTRLFILP